MSNGFNWSFSRTVETASDNQPLGAIVETSREGSESSRKNSAIERRRSTWWFWSEEQQQVQQHIQQLHQQHLDQSAPTDPIRNQQAEQPLTEDGWLAPTYRRMSSVVSYVYPLNPTEQPVNEADSIKRPEQETPRSAEAAESQDIGTWLYSFVWNPWTSNSETESLNSDDALLKSAKLAIETSKDSLHYAFKNNRSQKSAYGELAVSHTKTEDKPVRYKYKRVPMIANQVQEIGLSNTGFFGSNEPAPPATATNTATAAATAATAANLAMSMPTMESITNGATIPNTTLSSNGVVTGLTAAAHSKANSTINNKPPAPVLPPSKNYRSPSGTSPEVAQNSTFSPKVPHVFEQDSIDLSKPITTSKQTSPVPNGKILSSSSSIISTRSALSTYRQFIVTPSVDENFRTLTLKTKIRLVGEHLVYKDNTLESHLYKSNHRNILNKKTNKIKKIIIIGLHGFFPFKMVKTLIGESTGNSMTFTNEATKAIYKWLDQEDETNVDIETISLEGKGKIENRVENLYKLLLNWIEIIRNSDFVFMIGHSQGSAVAIHLLAKLLINNQLRPDQQKLGLLSMSGILQGPFQGLENKIVIRAYTPTENDILSELFEFQKANSNQSTKLLESMQILIDNNVKITLAGSINDQLIPMYSSLAIAINHPNIYRCINVGENCDYPDFIITLIKIILLLMNLGHGDHGLLIELSKMCMGTIYKGGHTKIYSNNEVYFNAVKHAVETTSLNHSYKFVGHPHVNASTHTNNNNNNNNNNNYGNNNVMHSNNIYLLPWLIRELLQDLGRTKHIDSVSLSRKLISDFKYWEPTQKNWKEVKYCLEGLEEWDFQEIYN